MSIYRVKLHLSGAGGHFWGSPVLDSPTIQRSLTGLIAHSVGENSWGQTEVDITLRRPDHLQAANEVLNLVQRCGYSVVNGEVSKLVSDAVAGAVVAGLGTGSVAGGITESPAVGLVAGVLGAIAGGLAAGQARRVEVVYQLRRNWDGGWQLVPIGPPQSTGGLAVA
ncbi:MAG TPA: hypothetical protein VHB02_03785 [Acidimicrobiales bacterium]|nr:hypothetical protein [Acidimicrobiales bacterium]